MDKLEQIADAIQAIADVRRDQTTRQRPDSAPWIAFRTATLVLDSIAAALRTPAKHEAE